MKIKSISFNDYVLTRYQNKNKGCSDIFDIAWDNSEKGIIVKCFGNAIASVVFSLCLMLFLLAFELGLCFIGAGIVMKLVSI